ncbi:MAG: Adenosylhomocysteinase, partial [uncultured Nocardioidaceae bacterium]
GLQGRRPEPGRLRPHRDRARPARDAGADGHARALRHQQAAGRGEDRGLAAHDRADRCAHRDARGARRRGPLGLVQHLLHPGPRSGGGRGRARRHPGEPRRRAGLRLEGRDPGGVLVVHPADPPLARRSRPGRQHDPRRRWGRHPARPPRCAGREGGHNARPRHRHEHRAAGHLRGAPAVPGRGHQPVDRDRQPVPRCHRGDHDRRPPPLRDDARRSAALPRDQRQRLGHQEQVRQQVRLPPLAHRRHQPGDRRPHRRQGRGGLRLRRRGQGVRGFAARPGCPRGRHRDRPDLRPAGGDGRLPGRHARGGAARRRHHHHRDRQPGRRHRRPDEPHEAPGDRRQHRALRQRDRHGGAGVLPRCGAQEREAAGRPLDVPQRHQRHRAVGGPAHEPRERHRPPLVRDVELLHQPGARPDRAVHPDGGLPGGCLHAAQAPRRGGRPSPPGRPRRVPDRADRRAGELPGGRQVGPVQVRPLPLL